MESVSVSLSNNKRGANVIQELKASNILVESAGVCKISGLGCLETEVRDKSRAVPRAVFWTAPEVIKTQYKSYDSKVDIWSTGCVVLQMFTGHRPWLGVEAVAVMYKVCNLNHDIVVRRNDVFLIASSANLQTTGTR
jgi:serine/threonine protein kinase